MPTRRGRTTGSDGTDTTASGEPGSAALARADKPTGGLPEASQASGTSTTARGSADGTSKTGGSAGGRKRKGGSATRSSSPSSKSKPKEVVPASDGVTDGAALVGAAAADIGSFIRAQREAAEVSIRQLAERAGVSNPYLSQIERGLRNPSAEVLGQIAKGLRMSAEVLYARAGILELRAGSAVRDAILTAPELSERQREVLVDIYESFRTNNALNADTVVDVD